MSRIQRAFDIAGACAGLIVFAPAIALISAAILIDDGAPVLFRQTRVGHRRRPFDILKFRSMRDGKVTRAGRILRATGLDEIPQFINMLRGDMSAVGPRPLSLDDVNRLGWSDRAFDFRWSCRPGLTGLAQLLGARADGDALKFDRIHAKGWRPALDCQLIAWSFAVNAFGKARVRRWLRRRFDPRRFEDVTDDCATQPVEDRVPGIPAGARPRRANRVHADRQRPSRPLRHAGEQPVRARDRA